MSKVLFDSEAWRSLVARVSSGLMVRTDSRQISPGEVFVALPGVRDGATYIPQAVERGASVIVAQPGIALSAGVKSELVFHPSPRLALGELAKAYFATDKKHIRLIGVTGTNGKTTITYFLEHMISHVGKKPAVIGTVEYRWPGHREEASHTTPDCWRLHELFSAMGKDGVTDVVMEVSSHALDQDRVAGLMFDVAALTNVTQDHLDYHVHMESYFQAKRKLFTHYLRDSSKAAINFSDASGRRLLAEFPKAIGYGLGQERRPQRALGGKIVKSSGQGLELEMSFQGQTWNIQSPLIGGFNAANLLTAQAMALCLELPMEALQSLSTCLGAPGRLERVITKQGEKGRHIFVDYAHTPDALENVLGTLKQIGFQRIITVFGCGGDRDPGKRPLMGRAVAKYSDLAVLTSDNPRHENPETIMDQVVPGLADCPRFIRESDRRRALQIALAETGPNDVLLVAGKGHEQYQQIGDEKLPFSDVVVMREILG